MFNRLFNRRGNRLLPTLCGLAALCTFSVIAADFTVDDSYTISERFHRYRKTHPELIEPVLTFQARQQVLFDRRYKIMDGRELHLDVFLPPPAVTPTQQAIMLIHGGGWRSGNKSHFHPLANLLAQQGYVVFTPEYRLSAQAPYPAGLIDINDAITFVKSHATAYGFTPTKLAIGGGSSGGQMAALIGNTATTTLFTGETPAADTRVNAVVDLDGVLDFTHPIALANENKRKDKSAAALWLGGAYEDVPDLWAQASAAKHITAQSPPMLIISSGQMRFTAGKEDVIAQLDALSIPNTFFKYENNIHTFWLFEPYLSETAQRIDSFLRQFATGVKK